jgi:hypothetical protein
MHTTKSLKDKKNHHIVFSYKKNSYCFLYIKHKKNPKRILACTLALITSLLEPWEQGQYFKNSKKIFLSSFSIWDYEFIRIPDIKM